MALRNRTRSLVGYGLDNALSNLAPLPVVANRAPTTSDSGQLGALWVWPAQDEAWVLVSNSNATATWNLIESSGGPGIFSSLLVNPGPVTTQGTGAVNISADAVATTVNIATGGAVKALTLGSTNGASATTLQSGSGNMIINSAAGTMLIESTNTAITVASGTGEIDISADAAATTVKVGTGAGAKAVTIGSTNTTSATTIQGGSGLTSVLNNSNTAGAITIETNGGTTETILITNNEGTSASSINIVSTAGGIAINGDTNLSLAGGGDITVAPATASVASPTVSITSNSNVIRAIFTGFTTANAGGAQAYTIVSSKILTTSGTIVNVTNLNASTNGAFLTITGIIQAAGSLVVHTANNGAGALGAGDNVIVTVWIIS
jgi:hypothetical protein